MRVVVTGMGMVTPLGVGVEETWRRVVAGHNAIGPIQRFDASGTPRGGEFQVNTYTTDGQYSGGLASDAVGNFVVTWDGDPDFAGRDDIHARLYEPDGVPLGGQFRVNTETAGSQQYPVVAMNGSGEFVIVCEQHR